MESSLKYKYMCHITYEENTMSNQQPPNWAPNAVPTIHGWVDPKSGELLVSKKGLTNTVSGFGKNRRPVLKPTGVNQPEDQSVLITVNLETSVTEIPNEPQDIDEIVANEPKEPVVEEKKRRPGRPAKNKV